MCIMAMNVLSSIYACHLFSVLEEFDIQCILLPKQLIHTISDSFDSDQQRVLNISSQALLYSACAVLPNRRGVSYQCFAFLGISLRLRGEYPRLLYASLHQGNLAWPLCIYFASEDMEVSINIHFTCLAVCLLCSQRNYWFWNKVPLSI